MTETLWPYVRLFKGLCGNMIPSEVFWLSDISLSSRVKFLIIVLLSERKCLLILVIYIPIITRLISANSPIQTHKKKEKKWILFKPLDSVLS